MYSDDLLSNTENNKRVALTEKTHKNFNILHEILKVIIGGGLGAGVPEQGGQLRLLPPCPNICTKCFT